MTKLRSPDPSGITRRRWMQWLTRGAGGVALAGGGSLADGTLRQRHDLEVVRLTAPLPGLPPALEGLRIVQLSDLHLEPQTKAGQIAEAVAVAGRLAPDLVVLTGDFVTNRNSPIDGLIPLLAELRAPLGVFGVLGNHDYPGQDGGRRVAEALRRAGVRVLRNEGVMPEGGRGLFLAGVESVCRRQARLAAALQGCQTGQPVILLAHEPDFADVAAADPRIGLQLSGHSHGGQVCLPGGRSLHTPRWAKRCVAGFYRLGTMGLHVNRGIGCTGLPIRFACRPEVTEILLHRAG